MTLGMWFIWPIQVKVQTFFDWLWSPRPLICNDMSLNITDSIQDSLRILAMYEAKTAKNSNFWMFWLIISWIRGQNVQKLQILLFFASYIASILNVHILAYLPDLLHTLMSSLNSTLYDHSCIHPVRYIYLLQRDAVLDVWTSILSAR